MACSCGCTVRAIVLPVCTFVRQHSIIKRPSFPAGLSHWVLFSLSLSSLSVSVVTLAEAVKPAYLGFGRTWSPLPVLLLMNWLHKALRQHTLSSVINAQIHSFLFILGGVWSFPTAEQMSPVSLGKCPPKTSVLFTLSDTCKLKTLNVAVVKYSTSNSP